MLLSQKIREVHFEKDHSSCKKKRVHYKIIMKQVWADKKSFWTKFNTQGHCVTPLAVWARLFNYCTAKQNR